nr:aldehyde dehydrogenase family protein [Achromobacter aegrifaciens]
MIADLRVDALPLTGSTAVGRLVAAQAGSLRKKQVLELGGSDPFVVLADADVVLGAKTAVKARFLNTGQSCISAKRSIVEEAVADRFVDEYVKHVAELRIGDPLNPETQIGPLAREGLRADIDTQVQRSIAAGAKLLIGGKAVDSPGFFYNPTVWIT